MDLLHCKSPEYTLVELDLFTAPMTQLTKQECKPLSVLSDNSPIEFFILGDGEKYLDVKDDLLYL